MQGAEAAAGFIGARAPLAVQPETKLFGGLGFSEAHRQDSSRRIRAMGPRGRDQGDRRDVSSIYLNYFVGQILIGDSRKRGTSRLSPSLTIAVAFIALASPVWG